jgi:hypothetical protein
MVEAFEEYGGAVIATGMGVLLLVLLFDGVAMQDASLGSVLMQMIQGLGAMVA